MGETAQFYLLSHIFISLIGSLLLWATWYHIRQRFKRLLNEDESQQRIDKGLAYLGAAVFIWVLSGAWGWIAHKNSWHHSMISHGVQSFFSTLNSFFLLMSLFFLDESPGFIHKNTKNVRLFSYGLVALAALSVLFFQWFGNKDFNGFQIHFIPDFILSLFTSLLLVVSFYRVFTRRGFKVIAVISIATVVLMMYSQLPEIFPTLHNDFTNNLMKIIAKTSLISVFLVLATNWVIQLASTPKSSEMVLKISDWSLITLSVPAKGMNKVSIDFASKTTQFKNLLKFAVRRKYGAGDQQYIEVGNRGVIVSQTYLTRILDNINTIAQLEDDQCLERKDLFTFVGQGKYRLRIVPENIKIDQTLLEEFLASQDHEDYTSMK